MWHQGRSFQSYICDKMEVKDRSHHYHTPDAAHHQHHRTPCAYLLDHSRISSLPLSLSLNHASIFALQTHKETHYHPRLGSILTWMENTMMGPYHWDSANHLDGNSALSMPTPVTAWVYPACCWAGIPPVYFASSKNAQAAALTSHWNLRRCSVHSHRRTHAHWHVSCIITHAANGPCTGLMKHEKWQLRWMSVRFFFSAGANKKKSVAGEPYRGKKDSRSCSKICPLKLFSLVISELSWKQKHI